jgi:hypothetical protein
MTNINFRNTAKGYSADYQSNNGLGRERRFFRASDMNDLARHYGWGSADEVLPGDEMSFAEMIIEQQGATPYRVVSL